LRFDVVPGSPRLIVSTPSVIPEGAQRVRGVVESPRRPGRYRVQLEGGARYLVSAAGLAETGAMRAGVVLTLAQVARLAHEDAVTAEVDRAVASLARQRRSRRQLEGAARRRGADAGVVAEALDRLAASGVLDDRGMAEAEAAARLRRGEAPARVRQRLRQKGVEAPVVAEALRQSVEEEGFDEGAACEALAVRRWAAVSALPPEVRRRRLTGFLLRRGFSGGEVQRVVRRLEREGPRAGDGFTEMDEGEGEPFGV
jgi:regulatory protein